MESKSVEFAGLLALRLCHDLLGPIRAVNNGIELLADEHDPEMRERCMESLAESAKTSATKLKFFQLAFGTAEGFDDEVDSRNDRRSGRHPGPGGTRLDGQTTVHVEGEDQDSSQSRIDCS